MILPLILSAVIGFQAVPSVTEAVESPVVAPERPRVGNISVEGPRGITDDEVRAVMTTVEGAELDRTVVDLDVRRIYAALPVENVLVYATPRPDEAIVDLRFVLQPRVTVRDVGIQGNSSLDDDEVLAVMELKEGGEFQKGAVEQAEKAVRRLYAEMGFRLAEVSISSNRQSASTVDIVVTIDEGRQARIGRISIVGPRDEFDWLAGAVSLKAGQGFSEEALQEGVTELESALADRGYLEFQIGEPVLSYDQDDNLINIGIPLQPGPKITFVFEGNAFFGERDLRDVLELDEKVRLTPGEVDEFGRRMRDLYQSWGFFKAAVTLSVEQPSESSKLYRYSFFEGPQEFIDDVGFQGNDRISAGKLYETQGVRSRRWFDIVANPNRGTLPDGRRAVNNARLLRLYRERGFLDAEVQGAEMTRAGGSLYLWYKLKEGPQTFVSSVRFVGNEELGDKQLFSALAMQPGLPFNPFSYESGLENIRRLYSSLGYLDAKVIGDLRYPESATAVNISVAVSEGPQFRVGQIFLQGNTTTGDEVIERSIMLNSGDIVNPEKLLELQRKLYRLGIFGSVNVDILSKDPQSNLANLLVQVQEKKNGSIDFGIEVGTAEGVILSTEASHRNLWGTARSLRGRAEVSYRFERIDIGRAQESGGILAPNEYRIETAYREPWVFDSDWAGTLTYIIEQNRREKTYNFTANKVIVGGDRELNDNWRTLPLYTWERDVFFAKRPPADCDFDEAEPGGIAEEEIRTDNPNRCDVNPDADPESIRDIRSNVNLGTYHIAGVEPVFIGDYRNDRFLPTKGALTTLRVFYAVPALGSDFHFLRPKFTVGSFFPIADGWLVALGLRTGYVALLPPTDELIKPQKFVLGGANSVRGFGLKEIFVPVAEGTIESREDGGKVMANYQAEFRFPLFWGLSGVVFQDGGQVWQSFGDVKLPFLFSAGPGLRYETPVGPIRLDWGWKLNPGDVPCPLGAAECEISPYEIHFAVGNAF